MGVKKCSIRNCQSSVNRKEDQGVTFQKFPKNTYFRQKWYKATQIKEDIEQNTTQYVCSRHFLKIDFETFSDSKYMLRTGAVPSIFPWGISDIDALNYNKSRAMDEVADEKKDNPKGKPATANEQNIDNEISKNSDDISLATVKAELVQETDIKKEHLDGDSLPSTSQTDPVEKSICDNIKDIIHNAEVGLESFSNAEVTPCDMNLEISLNHSPKKRGRKKCIISKNRTDSKSPKGDRSPAMSVGTRVEAKDFGEMWHPARIVEVDDDELEVLVHFDNWSHRHDEWISMSSPRLRQMCEVTGAPLEYKETRPGSPSEKMTPIMYKVGERCLARWSDNRRFPATVRSVVGNGKYEIVFDDGFVLFRRWSQLYKVKDPQKALSDSSDSNVPLPLSPIPYGVRGELSPMLSASPPPVLPAPLPFHKHLFDPSRDYLGPKSERRAMKRKLDVKVLFNIGKRKIHKTSNKPDVPKPSEEAPPIKKKRGRKKKIPPMTDIKVEDAGEPCTGSTEVKEPPVERTKMFEKVKTEDSHEREVKLEPDTNEGFIEDVVATDVPVIQLQIKNEELAVDELKKETMDSSEANNKESANKEELLEVITKKNEILHDNLKKEDILKEDEIKEIVIRESAKAKPPQNKEEILDDTQNKADTLDGIGTDKTIRSPKLILKRTQNDTWDKTLKNIDDPDEVKAAILVIPKKETETKTDILNKNPKVILEKADFDKHNKERMDTLKQEKITVNQENKKDFKEVKFSTLKSKKLHKLQKEILEKAAALELIRSRAKKKKSKKTKEKTISHQTDKYISVDKAVIPPVTSLTNVCEGGSSMAPHRDTPTPSTLSETNFNVQESSRDNGSMDMEGLKLIADVVATFDTQHTKPDIEDNAAKSNESAPSTEGCHLPTVEEALKQLREDQWCCRWVNGEPEGIVREMELDNRCVTNNAEPDKAPLPRRSVQVVDMRLPPGWSKLLVRRSWGSSAGQWDVVLVDPKGKRLRDKGDMRTYLLTGMTAELEPYLPILYDFRAHRKLSRLMGLDVMRDASGAYQLMTLPMGSSHNSPVAPVKRSHKRKHPSGSEGAPPPSKKIKSSVASTSNSDLPRSSNRAVAQTPVISSMIPDANPLLGTPVLPLEDGYVYVGSMRVQIVDNLFRCPAEDCVKNFRKDNLLRMHIKHYHRKMSKLLGSTPKVSDLAYARTAIPEDTVIPKLKCEVPTASSRPSRAAPKTPLMSVDRSEKRDPIKTEMYVDTNSEHQYTPLKSEPGERKPSLQDSPKLRNVLETQTLTKRPKVHYPVKRSEQSSAHIEEYYGASDARLKEDNDDSKMSDEHCGEQYQEYEHLDFEAAISTHTVTKAANWSKHKARHLKAVKRRRQSSDGENWEGSDVETRSSYGTPDSRGVDRKLDSINQPATPLMGDATFDDPNYMLNETGEKIKIVQMKREEIINCHCGYGEEDGLMIQCELCLCWQHAVCHSIERESQVPDKYVCSICLNPRRGRRSRRFLHDQTWLYEGHLPGGAPDPVLRRSHELTGNLIKIAHILHTLRIKYHVANKKDHPKLYLWAKDWEKENGLQEKVAPELMHSEYAELSAMISEIGKENLPLKTEDMKDVSLGEVRSPPSEDTADSQKDDGQLGLANLLSSPGGANLDLPISTSDLERLANSVQEPTEVVARSVAPEPEAAIESSACRSNLLKHIQRCQAILDARLDSIEAQVAELESQDPSFEDDETAEFFPRTKQTIQMLLRDLDSMEELGNIT